LNKKKRIATYIFFDWLSAICAWLSLFYARKTLIEAQLHGYTIPIGLDFNLIFGAIFIPITWIFTYWFLGYYHNIYRRSRLKELGQTFLTTFLGSLVLFFLFILDDAVISYKSYYLNFSVLFFTQFGLTYLFRFILSTQTNRNINSGKWGFRALLVGGGPKAYKLYSQISQSKNNDGFKFIGICTNGNFIEPLQNSGLQLLGSYQNIREVINEYQIEEIILAFEEDEIEKINKVISLVDKENVFIKIPPNDYHILSGMVKINNILGSVLIELDVDVMTHWERNLKRIFDIIFSILVLLFLSPLLVMVALLVMISSKGPIFYMQERLGKGAKPFKIIKFRSMKVDAEQAGPQLSSDNDPRITGIGRFLRKTRIDEFPQFWNVLKGDMSVVGPRPEREFFKNQIVLKAPHYNHLYKLKPGITSWGQVKYGYAENIEQMVQRSFYDLLYIENYSFALDLKIMIYTVLIMVQGRGK